ncbi:MAG: FISUMP domain-containing protein [Bacteroidota bacterium]
MKRPLLLLAALFVSCTLFAQDYNVTFSAYLIDTPTDVVDSVQVENISQQKSITINGDDTLHLVDLVQTIDGHNKENSFSVYPNPAFDHTMVEFRMDAAGDAQLSVYDMAGRKIISQAVSASAGLNTYKLSGLSRGTYVLSVKTGNNTWSETLSATGNNGSSLQIEPAQSINADISPLTKSQKSGTRVDWQYDENDVLIFTAWGEGYSRIYVGKINNDYHYSVVFEDCIDADGNKYTVVEIGGTIWMAENLKSAKYNNNVPIPNLADTAAWNNDTTGARCYYLNDSATFAEQYGPLYNFAAVNTGNLCPNGWHVPEDTDFQNLLVFLQNNGYNYDGTVDTDNDYTTNNKVAKALSANYSFVSSDSTGTPGNTDFPSYRNRSGFSALGAGTRTTTNNQYPFPMSLARYATFWTATEQNEDNAYRFEMFFKNVDARILFAKKGSGYSVRCIKD